MRAKSVSWGHERDLLTATWCDFDQSHARIWRWGITMPNSWIKKLLVRNITSYSIKPGVFCKSTSSGSPGCHHGSVLELWLCLCDLSTSSAACTSSGPRPVELSRSTRIQSACRLRSLLNCRWSLYQHLVTTLITQDNTQYVIFA